MNLELKSYLGIPLLPPSPPAPPPLRVAKQKGYKIKMFVHLQMEQLGKGEKKRGGGRKGETVQKRAQTPVGCEHPRVEESTNGGMRNINRAHYRYPTNRAPPNPPSPGHGISVFSTILIF